MNLCFVFVRLFSEREADVLKPLSNVEVVEKEEANFETEISEDDVVGEWKLRGQVLTRSPVGFKCLLKGLHIILSQIK